MIIAENLTKKFNGFLAVDNISFEVKESEIFGFLGPNGAGKTTTIRMLSTLLGPTSGNITVDGRDIKKDSSYIRSIIGILTEAPGMYEKISAYENLNYFASFYNLPAGSREANIKKLLEMFGLWSRKDELVATFSKGMKQKLALARALVHQPRILFLDEPTSGLDPESAHMVRDFIYSLKKENTTVFLCTHNLNEAASLSDRVCIINKEIIKLSSLSELQNYRDISDVEIRLVQPPRNFKNLVEEVTGVKQVSIKDNRLMVGLVEPEKTNPRIIKTLTDNGADIIYINEIKESLEEIYLTLIRQERNE
ncbi:MAG: ABC transporter ATP-binding protein [Actinomycetia bacterium]|nr:ABC transporter ATP-binding protein [Actinomycetes bacterium]